MAAAKPFFPVCMLLVQLASRNIFYFMSQLEDITFHVSLSLLLQCFNRHVAAFFEASAMKEVRIICAIFTTTV